MTNPGEASKASSKGGVILPGSKYASLRCSAEKSLPAVPPARELAVVKLDDGSITPTPGSRVLPRKFRGARVRSDFGVGLGDIV
jgi:hypothetical protein